MAPSHTLLEGINTQSFDLLKKIFFYFFQMMDAKRFVSCVPSCGLMVGRVNIVIESILHPTLTSSLAGNE